MKIRDPYGVVFDVDPTALPFWVNREGYQILDAPGDETSPAESADPKTSKAAVRRARDEGETS